MRILIVDDDLDTRKLLVRSLENWGHEPVEAESGEEALEIFAREHISMVIVDWMMPYMEGTELVRKLRWELTERYIYIIMLTAKSGSDNYIKGMEAGCDDFLSKPFDPQELRVRVRAGERVVQLEAALEEKNRKLEEILRYAEKDLASVHYIQKSLLPAAEYSYKSFTLRHVLFPGLHAPCDLLNYFPFDSRFVGFLSADMASSGVSASMMAIALNRILMPDEPGSPLFADGTKKPARPSSVMEYVNNHFSEDESNYLSLTYGILDTETGDITLSCGGQPSPILYRDGDLQEIITPDTDLGLVPDMVFNEKTFNLGKGDILLIHTDIYGMTKSSQRRLSERLMDYASRIKEAADLEKEFSKEIDTSALEDDAAFMLIENRA
ncbi:response regulator [Limisalsivibrio acetivorans]|uniref:response regulator n=1 Tax=Limisalsivibrio acetivorans TaxID=1304888 RepID=UPI0003B4E96A|nr:response regulator [Limisalsivibrio acetivorans]